MRETDRQIKMYTEKLPRMKERVIAALTMLLLAVVMTVSSSMAWLVLSSDPEVKGMNTTITANGNLEIALASGKVKDGVILPKDTAIGDSALPLVERNLTWGNLVNLGDDAYGLGSITLRPAALNKNKLLESPLYAAGYGSDGRVDGLESDFAYAYWNVDQFSADENEVKYGVRAISSVTYGAAPGQNLALADAVKRAEESINKVQQNYQNLAKNDALQDLVGLMAAYVQAQIDEKLGSGGEPFVNISPEQIESIYYLMGELKEIIEASADAIADVYNLEMLRRTAVDYVAENKFTGEYLLTATQAEIQNKLNQKNEVNEVIVQPSMLEELWQLKTDYNTIVDDLAVIVTYRGRNDVKYRNLNGSTYPTIETYVNHIADVATCTINGTAIGQLSMSNISSLTGGGTKPIVIHKGIIQRMDKFTGAQIQTNDLSVTIKVLGMGSTAKGKATTSATTPFVLPNEYNNALSGDTSYKGTNPIAGDTFGLAIDFFLRTNAPNAHLILQGSPVYETRQETATVNIGGTTYNLYNVTATVGEGEEATQVTQTAYRVENNDGTYTYYLYDREDNSEGSEIVPDEGTTPTLVVDEVEYIVGYSGVNRVWDEDDALLDETSTTQGAGSCYTFYASSPEDQEKSLQLLEHFRIAFIGESGSLLATASLDTERKFAQSGKVIVPLMLDITNESVTVNGETVYKITELQRNEATFVTALIYLEGGQLTNDQVLAAGEIQGQLNLQFGTTTDLEAMNDPALKEQKCTVSASMAGATEIAFDAATAADLTKTVTVTVDGYTPSRVEAYFLREINSTQGIRQGKIENFTQNAKGEWVGSHTFSAPGKYILREVILDGVTYELSGDPIVFTITGFTITEVYSEHNTKSFMLTDKSFDTSVSLTFATEDVTKMPTSVKGAFVHSETKNRTTVYFTREIGNVWKGSATFTTSGEYVMEYVELNNEYYGLAENQHIRIKLDLGLSVSVYSGETNFAIESGETRDLGMSLIIRNDAGETIGDLQNVWLQYAVGASSADENTLGAGMIWNGDRGMYEGTFHITKSGIYGYRYVSVKIGNETSTLGVATEAPTLTVVSTTVPDYDSKDGFGEIFALDNDGAFSITMKNADSATVDAELENENGETYYVRGEMEDMGEKQVFTFILPIVEGKQSGTWNLKAVYMTNVYGGENNTFFNGSTENGPHTGAERDEKGELLAKYNYFSGDNGPGNYYFRWWKWSLDMLGVTDGVAPAVTVVSNVNVSFTNSDLNANKEFGKTNGTTSATLGTIHNLGELELYVATKAGVALSKYGINITNVELIYGFDQSSVSVNSGIVTNEYGEYTMQTDHWSNLSAADNTQRIYNNISVKENDNTLYKLTANATNLFVAGRYIATGNLTLTLDLGGGKSLKVTKPVADLDTPIFEVYSMKPSVIFTATNPAAGKSFDGIDQKNETTKSVKNSIISAYEIECYMQAQKEGCNCTGITPSKATTELRDAGNAYKEAKCIINTDGHSASNVEYTYTPSATTAEEEIGESGTQDDYKNKKLTVGENAKGEYVYITDNNGIMYTYKLDNPLIVHGAA